MTKDKALTLALEALENTLTALREDDVLGSDIELMLNAITAVTEALAQPLPDLTAQQREAYQKGHNDGVAHHKQAVKTAQPSEDVTIIQYHEATIKRLEKRIEEMEAQPEQEPVAMEGWKLVPVKPTLEMIDALADTDPERNSVWDAVLKVAPPPPKEHQSCDKREWIGLTDEHIGIILNDPNIAEVHQDVWLVLPYAYAYTIEAKSKELNK